MRQVSVSTRLGKPSAFSRGDVIENPAMLLGCFSADEIGNEVVRFLPAVSEPETAARAIFKTITTLPMSGYLPR